MVCPKPYQVRSERDAVVFAATELRRFADLVRAVRSVVKQVVCLKQQFLRDLIHKLHLGEYNFATLDVSHLENGVFAFCFCAYGDSVIHP